MSERSSSKKTSLSGFSAFSWSTDLRAKTSSSVSGRGAGAGAGAGGGAGGGGGAGAVGVGGGGGGIGGAAPTFLWQPNAATASGEQSASVATNRPTRIIQYSSLAPLQNGRAACRGR